jgi:hypothetical protein
VLLSEGSKLEIDRDYSLIVFIWLSIRKCSLLIQLGVSETREVLGEVFLIALLTGDLGG